MKLGHVKHIHFIGIGGAGMSGIAAVLAGLGYQITGSDQKQSETTLYLESLGIKVYQGHDANFVEGADVVVHSTAVQPDNIEMKQASQAHIPIIHRSEMLAELMRVKQGIAIAGAHGKTTTTSLIAHLTEVSKLDPTVVIGGKVKNFKAHGKLGSGDLIVVEADESDGSFLRLNPVLVVLNNVDQEHIDYWGSVENLHQGVIDFANRVPFYGVVALCQDDVQLTLLRAKIRRPVRTFGLDTAADVTARILEQGKGKTKIRVKVDQADWGQLTLPLVGKHNVRNCLAAITIGQEIGLAKDEIFAALATFPGVERRFEILAERGPIVIDDYAHHPQEILATLDSAKQQWDKKINVVFQPHRVSRTKDLWERFTTALLGCDRLMITDIYAAGEAPQTGVDSATLVQAIHKLGHPDVRYVPTADILPTLNKAITNQEVVLFLGAGSITQYARQYAKQFA